MNYLGEELKRIRKENDLVLEIAASRIGISRYHLSFIERGERKGSFPIMVMISETYEVPLDYLSKFINGQAEELPVPLLKEWYSRSKEVADQFMVEVTV